MRVLDTGVCVNRTYNEKWKERGHFTRANLIRVLLRQIYHPLPLIKLPYTCLKKYVYECILNTLASMYIYFELGHFASKVSL